MFNVGGPEVIVIILVALIVLGPSELPKVLRGVAKAQAEVKKVTGAFQREAQSLVAPLKESLDDVRSTVTSEPTRDAARAQAVAAEAEGSGAGAPTPDPEPAATEPMTATPADPSAASGPSAADRASG